MEWIIVFWDLGFLNYKIKFIRNSKKNIKDSIMKGIVKIRRVKRKLLGVKNEKWVLD